MTFGCMLVMFSTALARAGFRLWQLAPLPLMLPLMLLLMLLLMLPALMLRPLCGAMGRLRSNAKIRLDLARRNPLRSDPIRTDLMQSDRICASQRLAGLAALATAPLAIYTNRVRCVNA